MRATYLVGLSVTAMLTAQASWAQTAAPQVVASTVDNDTSEIIVTASKRAQTLQDTPISVAVATAESIQRSQIRDLLDLQTLVPSLKVGQLQSLGEHQFYHPRLRQRR